jgi:hypothetical protein
MPKNRWDAIHHQRGGWLHAYCIARPGWGSRCGAAVADSCLLAVSCLITYWLATTILALAPMPKADNVQGGM